MNKTELIDHIAASTAIPKVTAMRVLEAVLSAVTTTLKDSGSVTLAGFGTFTVGKRAARTGRNDMHDAPHMVAEAILHAAQYAQRDVIVGAATPAPAARTRLAPRLLEKCMDFIGVRHTRKAAHI